MFGVRSCLRPDSPTKGLTFPSLPLSVRMLLPPLLLLIQELLASLRSTNTNLNVLTLYEPPPILDPLILKATPKLFFISLDQSNRSWHHYATPIQPLMASLR